jgi:PadR family transcriptional regulator, regulatory protein AphA
LARTPNRTRQALLGFLSWGPQSGYGLRKVIEGSVSNFWTESYGRIYPMLKELEEDGLTTSTESSTPGGRPSKVFAITDAGRTALADWLDEEPAPPNRRNELLRKIFFVARSDRADPGSLVENFLGQQRADLARYAETRGRLEAAREPPPDLRYWLMTLRFGELEAEAHLAWANEVLATLREDGRKAHWNET